MDDKKFKDMWNKAEYFMGDSKYEFSNIEKFISSSSKQVGEKIRKMYIFDIAIKLVITVALLIDVILYYNVQPTISYICMIGIVLIAILINFENKLLKQFKLHSSHLQNTKTQLKDMLEFLRNNSFVSLLTISSSYLFGFTGGILVYFFMEYGELRRMGTMDIFVFPTICLIGILMNYTHSQNIIKHQIKHLELCNSDMDESIVPFISDKIDRRQKSHNLRNVLIGIVVLLSLLVFVAILKKMGI